MERLNIILVVDDEQVIHETLDRIFEKSDFTLEHASTANQALEMIQRGYGTVLTDVRMPGMDGIQLLKRIKQLDPSLEVILMTGYASMESALLATKYGALAYLTKPFENPEVVKECVTRAVSLQRDHHKNEQLYDDVVKGRIDELPLGGKIQKIPFFGSSAQQISRHLAETLNDGLVFLDYDGVVTFSNIRFAITCNYPFLDILGRSFLDFVVQEDREHFMHSIGILLREGRCPTVELRLITRTDVEVFVLLNAVFLRDEQNRFNGIMLIISDVSQFRSVQRRLELLAQLVDRAKFEAILIYDENGKIIDCNQAASEMLGLSKGVIFGKNINSLLNVNEQEVEAKTTKALLESYVSRPDSSSIPVEIAISTIQEIDGNKYRGLAFVRDITELKKTERMKNEFIGSISHEIRTPLSIMKGTIDNLKDGIMGPLSAKQIGSVEVLNRNMARLIRIVDNLLDMSRIESHKMEFKPCAVDVVSLVGEIVTECQRVAQEKDILVESLLPEGLPTVLADSDLINQVVTNLLNNALRFAKTKIVVRGAVSSAEDGNDLRTYLPAGGHGALKRLDTRFVQISVIDDGPGIPKGRIGDLFNKFVQINRPEGGSGYKGTGLGLAICKEIIERHHGKIWAESDVGQGAKFHFCLPIIEAEL